MRRRSRTPRRALLGLAAAAFGLTAAGATAQPVRVAPDPAPLNNDATSDTDAADLFVELATDGRGLWVAVWESIDPADDDRALADFGVRSARSDDGGLSWSDPVVLDGPVTGDRADFVGPHVATDGLGLWLAAWASRNTLGDTLGGDLDLLVARSTNGITWSAPAAMHAGAATDAGDDRFPHLATDGLGNWVVVWDSDDPQGGTGDDTDAFVSRSTDGGLSWSAPAPLNGNADSDSRNDFEPRVEAGGAGAWVAVWESADDLGATIGEDFDILWARPTDAGLTWTAPLPLNRDAAIDAGDDRFPSLSTDRQGVWIVAWDTNETFGGGLGEDLDVLFARSLDDGLSWPEEEQRIFDEGALDDLASDADAFAHVSNDGGQNWFAVWQSSQPVAGSDLDDDILGSFSTDGGASWSDPILVNANGTDDRGLDIVPRVVLDPQGTTVVAWASTEVLGNTIGPDGDLLVVGQLELVEPQTREQQACLNALNADFAKVAKTRDKSVSRCLKDTAKTGASFQACLAAPDARVDKAQQKTVANAAKRCAGELPSFGATDPAVVNAAAAALPDAVVQDLFAPDPDAALLTSAEDKTGAKCQSSVVKAASKCQSARAAAFNACKKDGLRSETVLTDQELTECLEADASGKVATSCDPVTGSLAKAPAKSCGGVDLAAVFPGCDDGGAMGPLAAGDVAACADRIVACRVCLALDSADALGADCDALDDGTANGSCP